jgi:cytochrome c553
MAIRTKIWLTLLAVTAPLACPAQSTATLNMLQKGLALQPDLHSGEHLYMQYCSACHHRSGWGSGPREVPALAGQQDSYLFEQLLQFSNLERSKNEMHEVVTKPQIDSPQSLRDVSAYIASRPRNARQLGPQAHATGALRKVRTTLRTAPYWPRWALQRDSFLKAARGRTRRKQPSGVSRTAGPACRHRSLDCPPILRGDSRRQRKLIC